MYIHIEIYKSVKDSRIRSLCDKSIHNIKEIIDVYRFELPCRSIDKLPRIADSISNGISEHWKIYYGLSDDVFALEKHKNAKLVSNCRVINWTPKSCHPAGWVVEKRFLLGVTDSLSHVVRDVIWGVIGVQCFIVESRQFLLGGGRIPDLNLLFNPLIEEICIDSISSKKISFLTENQDSSEGYCKESKVIPLLCLSDEELLDLSKELLLNLNLPQMQAARDYFSKKGRNPHDIELEAIAQSWSEHCKHNIFSYPIDDLHGGIFKAYIRGSTEKIIKENKDHICASIFSDNAGAIYFDHEHLICVKVETHNSPSALEPFGGAMTGILGVNRDIIGFGMGAKPIANSYAFCFDDIKSENRNLYRDKNRSTPKLLTKEISAGVIDGVNVGGNCSGIPTVQGLVRYDSAFAGKPLVFVGSIGIIPAEINGKSSCEKSPEDGDLIVIAGGRTGRDGIHGATFSSSAISDHNVCGTEVQIGDPFAQKKLSDCLVKEVRDLGLYNAITDNGAGGLSSSVGEMGVNGFHVELDNVSLKYKNLLPWEIWISESQERMTLAVPEKNLEKFSEILKKHDVECCVIGRFNNSGKAVVTYNGKRILDLDCNFLHNGCPILHLTTRRDGRSIHNREKDFRSTDDILSDKNIFGNEFIAKQYDHEVQGISVLKQLQGENKVLGSSSVIKPVLSSRKGLAQSQSLSIITDDAYMQTAIAIEDAIRKIIVVGADPEKIVLLDNFCWSDSNNPEMLYLLKNSARACYDYSIAFRTPFISGKDSMFNDFKGYNASGEAVHIKNSPALLITSVGIVDDIDDVVSLDAKFSGDLIYIIGKQMKSVDPQYCKNLYEIYHNVIQKGIIASAIEVGYGGRMAALIRKTKAGNLNAELFADDEFMYSSGYKCEIMITTCPNNRDLLERSFKDIELQLIGEIRETH